MSGDSGDMPASQRGPMPRVAIGVDLVERRRVLATYERFGNPLPFGLGAAMTQAMHRPVPSLEVPHQTGRRLVLRRFAIWLVM